MIYSLNSYANKNIVGNKAYNLMNLYRSNYNIPAGFVLGIDTENTKEQIIEYFEEIIGGFPVIVRSSGISEDSKDKSFAGQFESILNINNQTQLFNAIEKVKQSANRDLGNYSDIKENEIAVIIQKQINAKYSGVYFTTNPVGKGFIIEYVTGHLSNMISGKENSYKITNKTDIQNETIKELYFIGQQLEEYNNEAQDIEFIIDEKSELWIVQIRPISNVKLKNNSEIKNKKTHSQKGVVLSLGNIQGKAQFIYDDILPEEAERIFQKDNILITYVLFPEYNKVFQKAKGVICMIDSITSHPAIISRELGIPCIGGINVFELSKKIKDLDDVIINTDNEEILFTSRIKEIKEKSQKGITNVTFPPTENYLLMESKIKEDIRDLNFKSLEKNIDDTLLAMQENFKQYLLSKNNTYLRESKSYLHNISHLLQNDFLLILKKKGMTHKELLEIFIKVDSGSIQTDIDRTYKVIKDAINKVDEFAKFDNEKLWNYKLKD